MLSSLNETHLLPLMKLGALITIPCNKSPASNGAVITIPCNKSPASNGDELKLTSILAKGHCAFEIFGCTQYFPTTEYGIKCGLVWVKELIEKYNSVQPG
jgi:hypothetical protein